MSKLKKGKYYVGDPCYIFNKSWNKVLDDTNYFKNNEIVKVFGKECIVGSTAYGDGTYTDNYGRDYNVDSGLIGVLPVSLISEDKKYTLKQIENHKGMHIIEFKEDFEVSISVGVFVFGAIIIDTTNDNSDEDEW